ncbi:MAG: hypothetical protein ACAI38_18710 [Myxococcota bacterium]
MVQLRPVTAPSGAPRPSAAAGGPGAADARESGAQGTDAFEQVVATVSKTHQIDDLITTNWDTTRCSASSAIAIVSMAGAPYVDGMAGFVVRELEARVQSLWGIIDELDAPDASVRAKARATLLPELQRHIDAFRLTPENALFELGYDLAKSPGIGVGVPPRLGDTAFFVADGSRAVSVAAVALQSTEVILGVARPDAEMLKWFVRDGVGIENTKRIAVPATRANLPWYRVDAPKGGESSVTLGERQLDLATAGQMLALYQLTGDELKLLERVITCLEAELDKAKATLATLRQTPRRVTAPLLQQLADSLLVTQQHTSGLNAYETGQALRACGINVEPTGRSVPWTGLARTAAAGDAFLLEGRGHAVTFGRLRDGRAFLFDSEGLFGDRTRPCLAFLEPGQDAEIDAHYGVFQATHRCRPARPLDVFAQHNR